MSHNYISVFSFCLPPPGPDFGFLKALQINSTFSGFLLSGKPSNRTTM